MAAKTPFPVGFWSDDATYVATARSLAHGDGYRLSQIPGEPLQTRYPPLYPSLLSLAFYFGPDYPANRAWLLAPGAVAAAALWFLAVKYAWPTHVEEWAEQGAASETSEGSAS